MPDSAKLISQSMREALFACFRTTTRLVQVAAVEGEALMPLDNNDAIATVGAALHLPMPDVLPLAALLGVNNSRLAMVLLASRL